MGIRETIFRLLDRGNAEPDPDELVELAVVPVASGPMLVSALRDRGIDAVGDDTFNVVTQVRSDFRVVVPRRDLDAATAVVDDRMTR